MITINSEGISIEKEPAGVMAGLLWDLLNIVGSRFTFVVVDCGDDVEYGFNHKLITHSKKKKVGLFSVTNAEEFDSLIRSFSEACIDDFYILINAYFNNVVKSCDTPTMFSDEGFLINALLLDYPQYIHVEESGVFIDFKLFKTVKFQLEHAAKRYEAKLKKND